MKSIQSRIRTFLSRARSNARKARKSGEAGFTLVELVVVIVIIGILAAMALPTLGDLSGVASANATAYETSAGGSVNACRTQATQANMAADAVTAMCGAAQ